MVKLLLQLPDEVLLLIVSHLKCEWTSSHLDLSIPPTSPGCLRFPYWDRECEDEAAARSKQNNDIIQLMRTCTHLSNLAIVSLYQDPSAQQFLNRRKHYSRTNYLVRGLHENPDCAAFVRSVFVGVGRGKNSIFRASTLFLLPNIHTIQIVDWTTISSTTREESPYKTDEKLMARSSVKVLRLLRCGATETILATLLSWPLALEEFYYQLVPDDWEAAEETGPFTCDALERVLLPQRKSINTIYFTHRSLCGERFSEYFDPLDFINFSAFDNLTTLRIQNGFLQSEFASAGLPTHATLPKQLEILHVSYHAPEEENLSTASPHWLLDLLLAKAEHLPALKNIMISADEDILRVFPFDYSGHPIPASQIQPWSDLMAFVDDFKSIGVELNIFLGQPYWRSLENALPDWMKSI